MKMGVIGKELGELGVQGGKGEGKGERGSPWKRRRSQEDIRKKKTRGKEREEA